MKVSRVSSLVAMVAVVTLVLSGVAYAHTVVWPTGLSISRSPEGKVAPGKMVTFSGRLTSEKKACVRDSRINLVKAGVVVAHRRTDGVGRYVIHHRVRHTAHWRVHFAGKVLNVVHPHNHTCAASWSSRIRVRVK